MSPPWKAPCLTAPLAEIHACLGQVVGVGRAGVVLAVRGREGPPPPFYQTPPNKVPRMAVARDQVKALNGAEMAGLPARTEGRCAGREPVLPHAAARVSVPASGSVRELPPTRIRYPPPAIFHPCDAVLQ